MVFVSVVLHKGRLWIHEDGACIFTAALNKVIPMSILRQKTSQARLFEKMYTDYISAKFCFCYGNYIAIFPETENIISIYHYKDFHWLLSHFTICCYQMCHAICFSSRVHLWHGYSYNLVYLIYMLLT